MSVRWTGICLLTFVAGMNVGPDEPRDFESFQAQVNALEEQERYREAIELTEGVWDRFPDRVFELIKEMEYLNEKTGRRKQTLGLWADGHRRGLFFFLDSRIRRYQPYLDLPGFQDLAKRDAELREAALASSKTIFEVEEPVDFSRSETYPLLIILHGGGSTMAKARERWIRIPAIKQHFLVAFVQSYRYFDSKSFGWASGDPRADREIRTCFDEIVRRYPVDPERVIVGGTSAGATMALDLALRQVIPVSGVIAFCPGKPTGLDAVNTGGLKIKVFMVGGEQDPLLARQDEVSAFMTRAGIPHQSFVVPGMGHGFPEDYPARMVQALHFLTD